MSAEVKAAMAAPGSKLIVESTDGHRVEVQGKLLDFISLVMKNWEKIQGLIDDIKGLIDLFTGGKTVPPNPVG